MNRLIDTHFRTLSSEIDDDNQRIGHLLEGTLLAMDEDDGQKMLINKQCKNVITYYNNIKYLVIVGARRWVLSCEINR